MDELRRIFVFISGTLLFLGCSPQTGKLNHVTSSFDAVKCQGSAAIKNQFIVQWEDGTFSLEKGESPEKFKNEFVAPRIALIKHVQINQKINLSVSVSQQNVQVSNQPVDNWGQDLIQASHVWSQGFKGQNIKVAVVDAMVDVNHPQLRPRIAVNTGEIPNNGIDEDKNGVVDDYLGAAFLSNSTSTEINDHGSHVAGIIAADPHDGSLSGVAPEAQIIPATFLDGAGSGNLGDAILAMQYAASRGAKIINASWGGAGCSESLGNAFAELNNKGILLAVAAGNSGADIDVVPFYPATFNLSNQITVSASDADDFVPAWSNTGFRAAHLTAPGVDILSTVFGGGYTKMDGTSMATPFVAGAAAVLWSAKPVATAWQIKTAILRGVDVIADKNSKTQTRGRLNLQKSLDELRRLVP